MNRSQRILILVIMMVLVVGVVGYQPAKAASYYVVSDSFDPSLGPVEARWGCWATPSYSGGCDRQARGGGRTDIYAGRVWLEPTGDWSDIGRSVQLPVPPPRGTRYSSCFARFWVMNWSANIGAGVHWSGSGQIEVLNGSTWTYNSVKPFTLAANTNPKNWIAVTTNTWVPPADGNLYIRLGAVHPTQGGVVYDFFLDDLLVQCTVV